MILNNKNRLIKNRKLYLQVQKVSKNAEQLVTKCVLFKLKIFTQMQIR